MRKYPTSQNVVLAEHTKQNWVFYIYKKYTFTGGITNTVFCWFSGMTGSGVHVYCIYVYFLPDYVFQCLPISNSLFHCRCCIYSSFFSVIPLCVFLCVADSHSGLYISWPCYSFRWVGTSSMQSVHIQQRYYHIVNHYVFFVLLTTDQYPASM